MRIDDLGRWRDNTDEIDIIPRDPYAPELDVPAGGVPV
jgi:hypothetical protein